jgi:hypothetical protein
MTSYTTIPSLAFANFRSKYLNNSKIPLIVGQMFHDLRRSFTGGAVDVYKPYSRKVKRYDVNSLYPSQMKKCPMPIGNITYFEGDISKVEENPFGFFEVKFTTPKILNVPILQTKIKKKDGFRTVAPLGS